MEGRRAPALTYKQIREGKISKGEQTVKIEQSVYELVEAGQYPAKCVGIEQREGSWGYYLLFTFELLDPNHAGVNVSGAASAKFSPKSKLYQWSKALFGDKQIPRDYTLNTDTLLERQCLLDLDIEETADGTFNRIAGVRPASREPRPAPPPVSWPDEPPPGLDEDEATF